MSGIVARFDRETRVHYTGPGEHPYSAAEVLGYADGRYSIRIVDGPALHGVSPLDLLAHTPPACTSCRELARNPRPATGARPWGPVIEGRIA